MLIVVTAISSRLKRKKNKTLCLTDSTRDKRRVSDAYVCVIRVKKKEILAKGVQKGE